MLPRQPRGPTRRDNADGVGSCPKDEFDHADADAISILNRMRASGDELLGVDEGAVQRADFFGESVAVVRPYEAGVAPRYRTLQVDLGQIDVGHLLRDGVVPPDEGLVSEDRKMRPLPLDFEPGSRRHSRPLEDGQADQRLERR